MKYTLEVVWQLTTLRKCMIMFSREVLGAMVTHKNSQLAVLDPHLQCSPMLQAKLCLPSHGLEHIYASSRSFLDHALWNSLRVTGLVA